MAKPRDNTGISEILNSKRPSRNVYSLPSLNSTKKQTLQPYDIGSGSTRNQPKAKQKQVIAEKAQPKSKASEVISQLSRTSKTWKRNPFALSDPNIGKNCSRAVESKQELNPKVACGGTVKKIQSYGTTGKPELKSCVASNNISTKTQYSLTRTTKASQIIKRPVDTVSKDTVPFESSFQFSSASKIATRSHSLSTTLKSSGDNTRESDKPNFKNTSTSKFAQGTSKTTSLVAKTHDTSLPQKNASLLSVKKVAFSPVSNDKWKTLYHLTHGNKSVADLKPPAHPSSSYTSGYTSQGTNTSWSPWKEDSFKTLIPHRESSEKTQGSRECILPKGQPTASPSSENKSVHFSAQPQNLSMKQSSQDPAATPSKRVIPKALITPLLEGVRISGKTAHKTSESLYLGEKSKVKGETSEQKCSNNERCVVNVHLQLDKLLPKSMKAFKRPMVKSITSVSLDRRSKQPDLQYNKTSSKSEAIIHIPSHSTSEINVNNVKCERPSITPSNYAPDASKAQFSNTNKLTFKKVSQNPVSTPKCDSDSRTSKSWANILKDPSLEVLPKHQHAYTDQISLDNRSNEKTTQNKELPRENQAPNPVMPHKKKIHGLPKLNHEEAKTVSRPHDSATTPIPPGCNYEYYTNSSVYKDTENLFERNVHSTYNTPQPFSDSSTDHAHTDTWTYPSYKTIQLVPWQPIQYIPICPSPWKPLQCIPMNPTCNLQSQGITPQYPNFPFQPALIEETPNRPLGWISVPKKVDPSFKKFAGTHTELMGQPKVQQTTGTMSSTPVEPHSVKGYTDMGKQEYLVRNRDIKRFNNLKKLTTITEESERELDPLKSKNSEKTSLERKEYAATERQNGTDMRLLVQKLRKLNNRHSLT